MVSCKSGPSLNKMIAEIESHLGQQEFQEAEKLISQLGAQEPESATYFNLKGLLLAGQQRYAEALTYFTRALAQAPATAALHNNLGNVYRKLNNSHAARQHYQEALRAQPHHAESYNNLATLDYLEQQYARAIEYLQKALRLHPTYEEAHYNLANAYVKQSQFESALTHYATVLKLNGGHIHARFNIAMTFITLQDFQQAAHHLEIYLKEYPDHIIAREQLGTAYLELGRTSEACHCFQLLITKQPDSFIGHHNLGILYLRQEHKEQALYHFTVAHRLDPSNQTTAHMYHALSQQQVSTVPREFVKSLFDQYAAHYDEHMVKTLHYQVPVLLRRAIATVGLPRVSYRRLLDLGCGTGQAAIFFQDCGHFLVGVDLSLEMLKVAQRRQAYDCLCAYDIQSALPQSSAGPYHIIMSSDVFVYMGCLKSTLALCYDALAPGGLLVFSTETTDHPQFTLQVTGRFAHHPLYLEQCAQEQGFQVRYQEIDQLRLHNHQPIMGNICVLERL